MNELEGLIAAGLAGADDAVLAAWERIRIAPEKWRCSPWGDLGGGFWVVAISGDAVIWYNDIEEGFNRSRFGERGVIAEYFCNQGDFSAVLSALPEAEEAEQFAAENAAVNVPQEVVGSGRIEKRQTTYWTLQPTAGGQFRVHFSGKREVRFSGASYESIEALDVHPILSDYQGSWSSLFVSNAQQAPPDFVLRMESAVVAATNGWRTLREYQTGGEGIFRLGYGLLMRGPTGIVRRVAETVAGAGITPSVIEERNAPTSGCCPRLLLMGRSFVVADSLRFERATEAVGT
jgi:hypothetical protein